MELRPGYKQTEVGVIPEDWSPVMLGMATSEIGDGIHTTPVYSRNGEYSFINGNNIRDGRILFTQDTKNVDHGEYLKYKKTLGDTTILLSINGTIGNLALFAGEAVILGKSAAYLNIKSAVEKMYVYYCLQTEAVRRQFDDGLTGTTIRNLGLATIRNSHIALPPTKAEQRAIAEALSDVDALVESLDQLIAKKRDLKQGTMQKLLRPKEGCVTALLPNVCWFQEGPGVRQYQFRTSGVKLFNGTNIEKGKIDLDKTERYISATEAFGSYSHFLADAGDIVIACSGISVDKFDEKVAFLEPKHLPLCMNTSTMRFKVIAEKVNKNYFRHFLRSDLFKRQISGQATGSAQLNFGPSHVRVVSIPLPDLNEQAVIAAILFDMDAEIAALEKQGRQGPTDQAGHDAEPLNREDSTRMTIGQSERATQNRVIALFRDELHYRYLGDWRDNDDNSNIEESLLTGHLTKTGYSPAQISNAIYRVRTEANHHSRGLYGNNKEVYKLLRYGVPVKIEAGKVTETVKLINWDEPTKNDFAIAEEVTLYGNHERRPDIVLFVNGIAVGMLELKNSRVSIGDGIRQNISNQSIEFNAPFFSTVQFIFAGNDSEGLQYGSVGTEEKYFLRWKEDEQDNTRFKLDKYLLKMCAKERLIELMHDFVFFDGGVKKLPRVHQYFGIKAAQKHVHERKGGIIWHTQGSGKSIVMVMLAKWILENKPHARVVIITDRDELDKQIEGVFNDAGETIQRTSSGRDLMKQLGLAKPRLLCSLVHKFGKKGVHNFEQFIKELEAQPCQTVGDIFVFVDECHRTQGGKLNRVMKVMMPNAVFIGFTGTPLLKKDKQTSLEVFGGYIHTYKFSEAVEDEVVLDLVYEARDIDQRLGSVEKIDAWFDAKTKGLNDWQRAALREQWGTMQNVLSSKSRMDRVVSDIVFDFIVKPRLSSERGNALLVVSSIYEACKYFTLFRKTPFKDRCAVITSYNPLTREITMEDTGASTETDKRFIYNTYTELLENVDAKPGMTKTETYEERAKELFKKEPANMKLLIVVDKLLTGFDAPPCTYLYIDKSMQDHGLFQAICRTNRLDGEDKDFGYIVDYKDLFKKVENAIAVYTSELDHSDGSGVNPEVLLKDRLKKGRERLDNALEAIAMLCEPVEPPKGELEHIHYFCGNTEIPEDLKEREPQRAALYKATAGLVRAFANIADELEGAGYGEADVARIKYALDRYLKLREIIRKASGESLDLKAYEADMRHLIDTYIEADEPRKISPFDNMSLLELIVKTGIADAVNRMPDGIKSNRGAIAETIENNVRSKIVKEHLNDPAFYDTMSALLDEIIAARKARAIYYEEYLKRIAELAKRVQAGQSEDTPEQVNTPGLRALYSNLHQDQDLAVKIDEAVKKIRPDGWRGIQAREQVIKSALYGVLQDIGEVERIFLIVKQQREY